jgi:sulfate transport system permease protein
MARRRLGLRNPTPMPGWALSFGIMVTMLSAIVLIPMAGLLWRGFAGFGPGAMWEVVNRPRVWSALELSFRAAVVASLFNLVFGVMLAWVLVRYRFPGKRLIDAAVDLPFALGAIFGIRVAYTELGIWIALIFVGLPFVVRTVQPVIEEIDRETEEASATLGASRLRTITHVILPMLAPAALTGFALALARSVGEYGSVIFIAGNLPNVTEIAPLLIVIRLEEFDYDGAVAIAIAMLGISFALLLAINLMQIWSRRRMGAA